MTLEEIYQKLENEGNLTKGLIDLQKYLINNYQSTDMAISDFLEKEFIRDPVRWDFIKDTIWFDDKERESNRFKFIQGDIIATTKPLAVGKAETLQQHNLWIVRSATCDCVRKDYILVSPIYPVKSKQESNSYNNFKSALYFKTASRFPLPKIIDESDEVIGYYTDFQEPFYLQRIDVSDVIVLYSLSLKGWNMFGATIKNIDGRANLVEEKKMRAS